LAPVVHKRSRKRDAILQLIRSTDTHPTAQWVYEQLKPSIPDLSLGTVYRNIKMFCEEGLISSIGVQNGEERFDGIIEEHPHFICDRCGRVIDLTGATVSVSDESVPAGCVIPPGRTVFRGLCANCAAPDPD